MSSYVDWAAVIIVIAVASIIISYFVIDFKKEKNEKWGGVFLVEIEYGRIYYNHSIVWSHNHESFIIIKLFNYIKSNQTII